MKKALLFLALCMGTGKLMAQSNKNPLAPFDNTI
jgi:hypothetical protein